VRNLGYFPEIMLRAAAKGQQWPVDIKEQQRALPVISHSRTIALRTEP
jgi:hypothetical protein